MKAQDQGGNSQQDQQTQTQQQQVGISSAAAAAGITLGAGAIASAALGPPSLNWAEEGLEAAAEHMLQGPQPNNRAWVHPARRSQSLQSASDGLFYVIQSFFKQELAKLRNLFSKQTQTSGSAHQTAQDVVNQHDWSTWNDVLVPRLAAQVADAYGQGSQDTRQSLQNKGIEPQQNNQSEDAKQYAQGRAGELVGMHINSDGSLVPSKRPEMQIDEDTRQALQNWLEDELKSGKGWTQITNDLYSQSGDIGFPQMQDWRARRIARTEASLAYNRAQISTARDAGVTKVEVLDGVMDDICAPVNGQTWTLEQAESDPLGHPNCSRQFLLIIE